MKITDPDVIKTGEKDLIDAVKDDLDLDVIRRILEKKLSATTLAARGGEIVVHDNAIAFRLDFDLNLSGSLMFDRQGNYIPEDGTPDADDIDADALLEEGGSFEQEEDPGISDPLPDAAQDEMIQETDILPEDDLQIDLPEYGLEDDEDDPEDVSAPDAEMIETDEAFTDGGGIDTIDVPAEETDELIDDDINDILKESQEFWEQKKD